MALPTVNADQTLKGLARYHPTVPRVLPTTADALQDRRAQWLRLGSLPSDAKVLRLHSLNVGSTPNPRWNGHASCDLLVVRGEQVVRSCVELAEWWGLASLMADLGVSIQAELRTDCSAVRGLALRRGARQVRHIHCPAVWQQKATAKRKIRVGCQAGAALSLCVETEAG